MLCVGDRGVACRFGHVAALDHMREKVGLGNYPMLAKVVREFLGPEPGAVGAEADRDDRRVAGRKPIFGTAGRAKHSGAAIQEGKYLVPRRVPADARERFVERGYSVGD